MEMDGSSFVVRLETTGDFEIIAGIETKIRPDQPVSAEALRYIDESLGTDFFRKRLVVELRATGQPVGFGGIAEDVEGKHGDFWIQVMVLPEFQRKGIGDHLYDILAGEAVQHRATVLLAFVREDELAGRAFLDRRGFVERHRSWTSLLDLERASTEPLAALRESLSTRGIEISTLAREGPDDPATLEKLYELDSETGFDVPRLRPFVPLPIAHYRRFFVTSPSALPEGWFIAKERDRFVAMSFVHRDLEIPDTLQQFYTCTRRDYRHFGLARALKLSVIEFGKKNHFRWIRTHNDSLNTPMWNLNEQLGFRRVRTGILAEKILSRADRDRRLESDMPGPLNAKPS